jgi:hypothetical protein
LFSGGSFAVALEILARVEALLRANNAVNSIGL